jgi:hypothetical protein
MPQRQPFGISISAHSSELELEDSGLDILEDSGSDVELLNLDCSLLELGSSELELDSSALELELESSELELELELELLAGGSFGGGSLD